VVTFVARCIHGGVDVVQLRDKELDARRLISRAQQVGAVCRDLGVPFIVNDRPDLALEVGADGVHVGQDDAPPTLARRIMGDVAIVGYSTHSDTELAAAIDQPVTYLSAGPVVPTPTKPGRPGTGIGYAARAAAVAPMPVFVTGGVSPGSVPDMVSAGIRHFVVVRWLTQSGDPEGAARALRRAIDEAIDQAGDEAIDEAIDQAGDQAGDEAIDEAIDQAGDQAGNQAGNGS